jgi:hypothetical protein
VIKKKRVQLEARDSEFEETGIFQDQPKAIVGRGFVSTQVWQKLTINELAEQWDRLEGDYIFLKWKLALLISDKFKSKIEFGQFLHELRIVNPNHTLCMIKQSTFYRYARAARFCEKFKINDLKEIGISATAIYDLSEIANESVVDESFIDNIKQKNLPVAEVKRLLYQAHSITGEVVSEAKQNVQTLTVEVADKAQTAVERDKQPVIFEAEVVNQLTEENMIQQLLNLLDSFNISSAEKLNLLKGVERKISGI